MPTPLAHGLAGFAVARTVRTRWRALHFAALAFAITLVPDLDFVPGVLLGEPGLYHRGITHSLPGALVISIPIALILAMALPAPVGRSRSPASRFLSWYAFVLPVYTAHLFLDLVSPDTTHNSGLRLFWPITNAYYMTPIPVPDSIRGFFALEFGPDSAGFFRTLFSAHALAVYLAEAVLFSPLLLAPVLAVRFARRTDGRERDAGSAGPGRTGGPTDTRPTATSRPPRRRRQHRPARADVAG